MSQHEKTTRLELINKLVGGGWTADQIVEGVPRLMALVADEPAAPAAKSVRSTGRSSPAGTARKA